MKVLIASSEVFPYSKTGGLADMVAALAKNIAHSGVETEIITPLYRGTESTFGDIESTDYVIEAPIGEATLMGGLRRRRIEPGLSILFVEHADFFERDFIYGGPGWDYPDNGLRFLFFSKAIAHYARSAEGRPDIVHLNDWHTALVPWLLRHEADDPSEVPATLLSIHNLAHQGVYPKELFPQTNLPWEYFRAEVLEYYDAMNFLKAGITGADGVATVSPTYAEEITTPEFGCGLDGALRDRSSDLVGILNGVDYEEWNTNANPHLTHTYGPHDLKGKILGKRALQVEVGLRPIANAPLFGTVSRFADQKGIDLLADAACRIMDSDPNAQFVVLGSGDPTLEDRFRGIAQRYPGRLAAVIGYRHDLAHRIEAGADFFVMPSRFEPCGLNQMYSLRYGTIPVVRDTGGLRDTVIDATESLKTVNGIKFGPATVEDLERALRKAVDLYSVKELIRHMRTNGMGQDHSWNQASKEYVALYQELIEKRRATAERERTLELEPAPTPAPEAREERE